MKTDSSSSIAPKSLAEVVRQVDNEKDLHEYILSHEGNQGAVAGDEVKYEPHHVSFPLGQVYTYSCSNAISRHLAAELVHPHSPAL
jgi:hypothetical protein